MNNFVVVNVLDISSYDCEFPFVKMAFNKDFIISISKPCIEADLEDARLLNRDLEDTLCSLKVIVLKHKGITFANKLDTALVYVKESFDEIVKQLNS